MFDSLSDLLKKIKPPCRAALLGSFLFGLLSQGMGLFNKYSYHDDTMALFGVGQTYTFGRWMLDLLAKLERALLRDGHFSLPLTNGVFSLLCIAMTACIIVSLLDLHHDFLCFLIGGVMTSFPAVTGTFAFMYTAPYYFLALLMGTGGVALLCRYAGGGNGRAAGGRENTNDTNGNGSNGKSGLPKTLLCVGAGLLLIACSVGIYQAYFPVFVSVMVLYFLECGIADTAKTGILLRKILAVGFSVLLSMLLYLGINAAYLRIHGGELTDYRGINSMVSNSPGAYVRRILSAFHEFLFPYKNRTFYMFPHSLRGVYWLILFLAAVLAVIVVIRTATRSKGKALLMALLFLVFPLAMNFIFVMTEWDTVHTLMVYGQVMIFVLLAWLTERTMPRLAACGRFVQGASVLLLLCSCLLYCRFDNRCYLKAEISQSEAISYFTTLITQIKSAEGYRDGMQVAYIDPLGKADSSLHPFEELADIKTLPYYGVSDYINNYSWKNFMRIWCGFYPDQADPSLFKDLPEVKAMPAYPDQGSVKIINNTVVVKF